MRKNGEKVLSLLLAAMLLLVLRQERQWLFFADVSRSSMFLQVLRLEDVWTGF